MNFQVIEEINDPVAVYNPKKQYTRRSDVWPFMERDAVTGQVRCKLCGYHLTSSSRSGTSNLRNHLINRHADQYRPARIPDRLRGKYADTESSSDTGPTPNKSISDGRQVQSSADTAAAADTLHAIADIAVSAGDEGSGSTAAKTAQNIDIVVIAKSEHDVSPKQNQDKSAKKRKGSNQQTPPSNAQSKTYTVVANKTKKKFCSVQRSSIITNFIFRMLVEDMQPVSIIEGPGFRGLTACMEPGYIIPPKETFEARLSLKLKEGRQKLQEKLTAIKPHMAVACELWTDYQSLMYLTLTSHHITEKWDRESWVLGTIEVSEGASHVDIADIVKGLCEECGVDMTRVVAAVYGTDTKHPDTGTSDQLNVLKSICEAVGWECITCAGQMLEVSIQNALTIPAVQELIQAAGKLVAHLTLNTDLYTMLRQECQETLKQLAPSGGWLSTSDVFAQLSKLQEPINSVLGDDYSLNLSDSQWKLLPELVQALESMKAAFAVMNDVRNTSTSCWLPVVQGMLQHIESYDGQEMSAEGVAFRETLSKELHSHCELHQILPSSVPMLASAVDPRFHHLRFLADDDKIPVVEELKQRVSKHFNSTDSKDSNSSLQEDTPFFKLLGEDEFNKKSTKPEDEIDLFRLERPVSRETDPLNWWRLNTSRFPGLAKLACAILSVPATALPLGKEEVVRASRENRRRLDASHVDAHIFLHKNLNLFL